MRAKRAIIVGAGPGGLTAAYELLTRTGVLPIVLEKSGELGGISRTIQYKGNRIDIGGHRFFSKSDRVMDWWLSMLPMEALPEGRQTITYQRTSRSIAAGAGPDASSQDNVMLLRQRRSRIYYLRRFFDYPITLSRQTLAGLGPWRTLRIGIGYLRSALFPLKSEQTLEDFLINRFGRELYLTFFKSYTEKVWGVPCSQISATWGAQRIKGLSIWKTLLHALRKLTGPSSDLAQKSTETSLIEQFLYPKFGPGQMWEEAARRITALGGEIRLGHDVDGIVTGNGRVTGVRATDRATGQSHLLEGDYFFSTMPVRELLDAFDSPPPPSVLEVSRGLIYRDFLTVGLLMKDLKIHDQTPQGKKLISDNWIYIQEPDVQVGRLQIFNNWSPYLVADRSKVWIGLEYFCNTTGDLWTMPDAEMIAFATEELARIGIIDAAAVEDATVIRVEKTYPAYFGTYDRFGEIRAFVDSIENLFLIGRNGMHRYNNQDHSMLTAMMAVDNIAAGVRDKSALWDVNTETDYHEEKK